MAVASNRRLAAIMFTDIVGFTSLMGADETATLALLQENHRIQKKAIDSHGGVFIKELGDGILAYFDDPNRAISCSIAMQKTLSDTSNCDIRIGLHLADIFVEDDDIYGDGVNIASRVQSVAEPGGIYLTDALHQQLSLVEPYSTILMGKAKLKNVKQRYSIYAVQGDGIPKPSMKRFQAAANPKKKFPVLPTVGVFAFVVLIAFLLVNYLNRQAQVLEAEVALDQIEELVNASWRDFSEAYYLAKEVEEILPNNQRVKDILKQTSVHIDVTTDPPGAEAFIKLYSDPEASWQSLGTTPLDSVELPIGTLRWKIKKEGYVPIYAAELTFSAKTFTRLRRSEMRWSEDFHRKMDKTGTLPAGMARVAGSDLPYGVIDDFFMDVDEVTNEAYQQFVDQDGYDNAAHWQTLIKDLSDSANWRAVLATFVDQTSLPGPATWVDQEFPSGSERFPVSGVNWYEANAYAHFAGKSLPTKDHWGLGRGEQNKLINVPQFGGNAVFAPFSNYHGKGTVEVGSSKGITSYGLNDMAGNVREWCWNESVNGRWMRGGAWNDNPYMFGSPSQADPFDRSDRNGFRCAMYLERDSIPDQAFMWTEDLRFGQKAAIPDPVSDTQFKLFAELYNYDSTELHADLEILKNVPGEWTLEKVEFDAAYNNERTFMYIFIPANAEPPYQTVLYGPGSTVFFQESSEEFEDYFEFPAFLSFFVQSGRAVIFPILEGTFERKTDGVPKFPRETFGFTDYFTGVIKDYRRCLDYMETRSDFNMEKIAFYGMSWGPHIGTFLSAIDERISINMFYAGGLNVAGRAEANMAHFLPRVKIPTLMINGRYDSVFPLSDIQKMFEMLGTRREDKKLVLFDSDHLAPRDDLIRETLSWIDQYFGQVVYIGDVQRI